MESRLFVEVVAADAVERRFAPGKGSQMNFRGREDDRGERGREFKPFP